MPAALWGGENVRLTSHVRFSSQALRASVRASGPGRTLVVSEVAPTLALLDFVIGGVVPAEVRLSSANGAR